MRVLWYEMSDLFLNIIYENFSIQFNCKNVDFPSSLYIIEQMRTIRNWFYLLNVVELFYIFNSMYTGNQSK